MIYALVVAVVVAVGGVVVVDILNKTLLSKIVQISCAEKNFSNKVFSVVALLSTPSTPTSRHTTRRKKVAEKTA